MLPPASTSPTSRSSPTASWPSCATCPSENLALELLKKLLNDEIKAKERTNKVQADRFSAKLEASLNRYHNRAIETAQVIEALIELGREMREDQSRAEKLGISEDEVAFYDALAAHETAVTVLGDEQLRIIARAVADAVRRNVTIDWDQREQARAKLRLVVKKVLRSYGYPPDKQEAATHLVIEQAENFARHETMVTPLYRG